MRIAIATDQDFVSSDFCCCPACTIVDIENGKIKETFIIPNPGCKHKYWAELFCRNSIKHLIVGNIGTPAKSVLSWWGIEVMAGVEGPIDDVVRRFVLGELQSRTKSARKNCESVTAMA